MKNNGEIQLDTNSSIENIQLLDLEDLEFDAQVASLKNEIEAFEELILPESYMESNDRSNYIESMDALNLENEFSALLQNYENKIVDEGLCKKMEELLIRQEQLYEDNRKNRSLELKEIFENTKKEALLKKEEEFTKLLEEKNRELAIITQKQRNLELHLASLQLQLSPHFIFNSLQSIQSYILKRNALVASDYLSQFARLMRAIIKSSSQDIIPINEEIDLLNDYLQLEQDRFNFSFQYHIE
ncbi:MAG: histidine kinase, partial [Bacteroidetes bacterium]|nr:histidine kinase [Bacteroidota bacterium]